MTFLDHCGMFFDSAQVNFALLALLLSLSLSVYLRARLGRRRLAPGPKGHWFLGNAAQAPAEKPWLWYMNLHEEYGAVSRIASTTRTHQWGLATAGDIVRITVPGSEIIVLRTLESVQDLFVKRSTIYSDRARQVMTGEM